MKMKETQIRLDVLTGGSNALMAMLAALIKTHPSPGQLLPVFLYYQEWVTALHLHSPYGEGVAQSFAEVCQQFQVLIQQAQSERETSPK